MSGPDELKQFEDNWVTTMGAMFPGERVIIRGENLFTDLYDMPLVGALLFVITGKKMSPTTVELMSRLSLLCTNFPDPRIWNNRVSALTGTAKSSGMLAISAASAVTEAKIYGKQAEYNAATFINRVQKAVNDGEDLDRLLHNEIKVKRQYPAGFGRPVTNIDERIGPLKKLAKELGLEKGKHYNTALKIDEFLKKKRYRMRLNSAGLASALIADQELTPRDHYYCTALSFWIGFVACHVDSSAKKAGTLFPMTCNRVSYQGASKRKWQG